MSLTPSNARSFPAIPSGRAVTVSGIQVLSTTWKSTDGTVSHGKYIIGNAIVYRDMYRGSTTSSASDGVSSQNFSFTAPPRGTPNWTCLPLDVPSFARANHRSHSVISGRAFRHGRAPTADVDARSTSVQSKTTSCGTDIVGVRT